MTEQALTLRHLREPNLDRLQGGPSVVKLDAEGEWIFQGVSEVVDKVAEALGALGSRLTPTVLRVRFGNAVGVFRIPGVATLEVRSGKWGEDHFEWMLADLVRSASALPFAAGGPSALPYDRSLAAREDVLYHAFIYLRHILSDHAPAEDRLGPALAAILHDPYRRLERVERRVHLEVAGDAEVSSLPELLTGGLVRAEGPMRGLALARTLEGHLPRTIRERAVTHDLDTPENRFVLAFLDTALGIVRAVEEVLDAGKGPRSAAARIKNDCLRMRERIEAYIARPLWREIGRMTYVPAASTVLQRRRGYREVFRHFSRLRLTTRRLPLSKHEARDLLDSRDIARLYELWAYFAFVEAMIELLGPPARAAVHEVSPFQIDVRKGFTVAWPGGQAAVYNACFSRASARGSYSLSLFPDVTLELPGGEVHLFDAKFKLRWLEGSDEALGEARLESTSKEEDLYKMHAYRDAITGAQSAWALYPGSQTRFYATNGIFTTSATSLSPPFGGVGAVPLLPEPEGRCALGQVLAKLLKPHASI
ncbi:DUF2357 domain-containing protein [Sorangium sp. So ce118]